MNERPSVLYMVMVVILCLITAALIIGWAVITSSAEGACQPGEPCWGDSTSVGYPPPQPTPDCDEDNYPYPPPYPGPTGVIVDPCASAYPGPGNATSSNQSFLPAILNPDIFGSQDEGR